MTNENYEGAFCDFCGKPRELKFCPTCGMDYCDECRMTHDAQHEFVAEAMGVED